MKAFLNKLWHRKNLSSHEVEQVFTYLQQGHINEWQFCAFLSALQTKGITANELFGAYSYFTKNIEPPLKESFCVQVMGTGKTDKPFNISTCAALIACCKLPVLKPVSRAISSSCGSADIIDALGLQVDNLSWAESNLADLGISFIQPHLTHPILSEVGNLRRSLQMPTIFDLVIPFLSFSTVKRHFIGLYSEKSFEVMKEFLDKIGPVDHIVCVYGGDPLDAISIGAPTKIIEKKKDQVTSDFFSPKDIGLQEINLPKMKNSWDSSDIILEILQNRKSGYLHLAAVNAGAILYIGKKASSIEEGYATALNLLEEGSPYKKFGLLKEKFSQKNGVTSKKSDNSFKERNK